VSQCRFQSVVWLSVSVTDVNSNALYKLLTYLLAYLLNKATAYKAEA